MFDADPPDDLSGRSLEALGRERYVALDIQGSISAHQRAFAAYRRAGAGLDAARVARMLSWLHFNVTGEWAIGNGWAGRATDLLLEAGETTSGPGWVAAMDAISESEPIRRRQGFERALSIARRVGDPNLEFETLGWMGLDLVLAGKIDDGFRLLDEALTGVCAGEVDDLYVSEGLFCGMLMACERVHDVRRAEQWVQAGLAFARDRELPTLGAFCRSYYGGILTTAGRFTEAEANLTAASRVFDASYEAARSLALIRLADLRVKQGRLEEAALLLEGREREPGVARPLAALHLARDQGDLAREVAERGLADAADDWPVAAPLLALLVDINLRLGAKPAALEVAERLSAIADRHQTDYLLGCASLAWARLAIAAGEPSAFGHLREALTRFTNAGAASDAALVRLEIARLSAPERPEVALAEASAALAAFEEMQALRAADAAAALVRSLGGPARTGPRRDAVLTKRETEVLELLAHGLPNPEIADRLYISPKTVEHHVGAILGKLNLRNRAEAAAFATRTRPQIEG